MCGTVKSSVTDVCLVCLGPLRGAGLKVEEAKLSILMHQLVADLGEIAPPPLHAWESMSGSNIYGLITPTLSLAAVQCMVG